MSHLVLSRKYRPQAFDELVGQSHVGRILRNAIQSGRIGHAYLFVGPRGVGKTTTARIFAKALNCAGVDAEEPRTSPLPEACGACASCTDITAGADLDVVEMDAASNNHVEDVRRLREQVGYATVRSRFRIWIVDEVHMLSIPAFNAFLKTLEEPPEGVKFLFCTTEEHRLPETFRSRCQRIEFRPIAAEAMAVRLHDLAAREGFATEDGLCDEIAAAALGGLRDAESLLEQLIAACPEAPSEGDDAPVLRREDLDALAGRAPRALLDSLHQVVGDGDAAGALDAIDAILASACKPGVLLEQWLELLRAELVRTARGEGDDRDADASARRWGVARVARSLDVLLAKRAHLRAGADGTLICQVTAVELARLPHARDLDEILAALSAGDEDGGGEAAPARPPSPPVERMRPSPHATSPAPDPVPPPSAADVQRRWDEVLVRARAGDGRLAEALRRARPGAVRDGMLELHVPSSDALASSTLVRREAVCAFREATGDVFGAPLGCRLVREAPAHDAGTTAAGPASASSPRGGGIADHPSIRLVRETTDGRLLNVEEETPPTRRDAGP